MWEDYAIAIVVMVFNLTTLPLIMHRTKVPILTSLPMMLGATVLVICYVSLDLWFSVFVELFAVVAWAVIYRESVRPL